MAGQVMRPPYSSPVGCSSADARCGSRIVLTPSTPRSRSIHESVGPSCRTGPNPAKRQAGTGASGKGDRPRKHGAVWPSAWIPPQFSCTHCDCKYTKAFFRYHKANTPDFDANYYRPAAQKHGHKETHDILKAFQAPILCSAGRVGAGAGAGYPPQDRLFAPKIESDEASWNFDVNVCKVAELKKNSKVTKKALEVGEDGKPPLCPKLKRCILVTSGRAEMGATVGGAAIGRSGGR
jgi:hypothetical protein